MLSRIKNTIAQKIINIVTTSEKKKKENLWKQFTDRKEINLPHNFPLKDVNIFKGRGADFGDIFIDENFFLRDFCNILVYPEAVLTIGKGVFFNNYCSINCLQKIDIGNDTIFGEGVKIYDHNHMIYRGDQLRYSKENFTKNPVKIGNNCWIASNVTILKGVTIGDNCIIGANCLIHKSIPANSIVKAGNVLIVETI